MKFLSDVSVGKKTEEYLKIKKYDVLCVREIDPKAEDKEISKLAVQEKRIVTTIDKDFGEFVYNSALLHEGVLLLRFEDEKTKKRNFTDNFK